VGIRMRKTSDDSTGAESGFSMPCVLIVEDDPDVRAFLECLLAENGYETTLAQNGRDALIQMAARKPSVLLLDLHMPVMDGWEFRREQLDDPRKAVVPVVAMTAHYDPHDVERTLGVKCVTKPIEVDQLLAEVQQACAARRDQIRTRPA
jgi:CheY-like chemotaxis protein